MKQTCINTLNSWLYIRNQMNQDVLYTCKAIVTDKTRGPCATSSPEKTVQINKHMIIKWHWLREEKKNYLLFENWMVLHLNKLGSPSPKDALCQIWLKLAQWTRL